VKETASFKRQIGMRNSDKIGRECQNAYGWWRAEMNGKTAGNLQTEGR